MRVNSVLRAGMDIRTPATSFHQLHLIGPLPGLYVEPEVEN